MRASRWLIVFVIGLMIITPGALLVTAQDPTAEPEATAEPVATEDMVATPETKPDATLDPEALVTPEAPDDVLMQVPGAVANLVDASGNAVGQVSFFEHGDGKVSVTAMISGGLEPGFHGLHIHETGQCDPNGETPFASAGGHFTGDIEATHDDHAGDLPILLVMSDGTAEMTVVTDHFVVLDLFDEDGSAVMIHGGADNFANIPERYGEPDEETLKAGDAGARVACGVVTENIAREG